jgi:hypothetical protein
VMEQREQSEACFDFAESRQNSTIVKPIYGWTCYTTMVTWTTYNMIHWNMIWTEFSRF